MRNTLLILPVLMMAMACKSPKNVIGSKLAKTQLIKDISAIADDKMEGRKTGTHGSELARSYIINRLEEIGIQAAPGTNKYVQDFQISSKNGSSTTLGKNILAYIPGKTDNVIVISAHYDHLGIINGEIYNGADDNASGVGALLNFASYFNQHQPTNSIILAFFDGEEMGLQGSKYFVSAPSVPLVRIKMNLNMDMIAHNDKQELYVCGTFKYPELKKFIISENPRLKLLAGHDDPKLGHDNWTDQSDQGSFNAKEIPFLYFGVEDHKDYHKATDEVQNINAQFYTDATQAILNVILKIDADAEFIRAFKSKLRM